MRIFHRLFLTHLLVAFLALMISSGYVGLRVFTAARQTLFAQLTDYGQVIASLLEQQEWGSEQTREMQETIDLVERGQSAHIWLVDREGLVRMASSSAETAEGRRLPPELYQEVLKGEEAVTLWHTFRNQAVAVPVVRDGEVLGAVILRPAPLGGPDRHGDAEPLRFLLYGALFAVVVVAGVSYYLSQRIARPISLVRQAGQQVARGDFSARVDWRTRDEVGELVTGFNEMATELGRLESARKELLTQVSHELKGPLARISGYLEAIHDGIGGQEGRQQHFQVVRQEVGRLTRMVGDLLDISRLEAGRLRLHPIPCDITPYLSRAIAVFDGPARAAQVTLQTVLLENPPIVLCEPERVEQVLVNLLQNALSYTPAGGSITITSAADSDYIAIYVRDTGPGIPPEEQELIWDRFHKIDRARTPNRNGSGLGLTIAKQLIELQGGRVWVESTPGQGSLFGFTLPIATPET